MSVSNDSYRFVDWPAPSHVKAIVTTRLGGESQSVYSGFNLADHVGDDQQHVLTNRALLQRKLNLKRQPFWLNQTHSNRCVAWKETDLSKRKTTEADASYTHQAHQACVVMTADCLPILFTNQSGNWVAACHAGWRGLASGVIETTLKCYSGNQDDLIAWIGPAISQKHFEVGEDVRDVFVKLNPNSEGFFKLNLNQRYQFDFIGLARQMLVSQGLTVYGGDLCSYDDSLHFYSYRRDGQTGRMASLIWFE